MDALQVFEKALMVMGEQVDAAAATPKNQTACSEWTADELINHVVAGLQFGVTTLEGGASEYSQTDTPWVLGDDPAEDYREAAAAVLSAYGREDVLDRTVQTPGGPMTAGEFVVALTFDAFVHAWDLSQATGVEGRYPAEVLAVVDGFCRAAFSDARPPVIGPEVEAPEGATDMEKLVTFLGRKP